MAINSVFELAARAMNAQMVRINTVASNLANADAVSGDAQNAYRPIRPVFETVYQNSVRKDGLASVKVDQIVTLDRAPERVHAPDRPMADADGYIYRAAVSPEEEMVEMMDASRQYQNTLEVVSTIRTLMARTMSMGQ
ncbi:flagellar basal body rod protein FlgC [Rhodobacteraceae bacterium XHP0102]|nr:flagellar basal body rod protein FlgC [Rhodobacteraceae bacterium XHP0102]